MIDELEDLIDDEENFDEETATEKEFNPSSKYTSKELEEFADALLHADADRELCRQCRDADPKSLPYGEETGHIESKPQYDKDTGEPLLDEAGEQLYVDFPELRCSKGHRWYKGEGPRRDIRGPNPILFASHLYQRQRREIQNETGIPNPEIRQGIYNRVYPKGGRKVNSPEQRRRNGASFYRAVLPWPLLLPVISTHINLVILGILSIGVLLWLWIQKNGEQRRQHICVPIMQNPKTTPRKGYAIDVMRQPIE